MAVSLVIPTFNRASLLREAALSALQQGPAVTEVLVCDDGSTDDTPAVCATLAALDSRVVVSRTPVNHGAPAARNRGLALARGEYVMFVDSDDVLAEEGLAPLVQTLRGSPEPDYAYGLVVRTDEALRPLAGHPPVGAEFGPAPSEVAGYHWHTMGAVYRKTFLQGLGGWDEALTGSQDWELQARVKLAGGRGQFVRHTVGYWREHSGARVGAVRFREDYVHSVVRACVSIRDRAEASGLSDQALRHRLARKLFVHALEWGAHQRPAERADALAETTLTLRESAVLRNMVRLWGRCPVAWDGILHRWLLARR